MKGANRKLFRKPGLARQAIGILASSKELADQVQQGAPSMMPQQPVPKFQGGGLVDLASMLGVTPAGYEMQGEEMVARPGFGGFYERLSGISDPVRAREQSGIDLMKLGARIMGGESTSATRNVAQGLTSTLEEIDKNRQQELANTLAVAKLRDDKLKEQQAREATRLNRRVTAMNKLAPELKLIGVTVNPDTGKFDFVRDGEVIGSYDNYVDIPLNENEVARFQAALEKSGKITDQLRTVDAIYNPEVPFGRAMTELITSENFDRKDEATLASEAEKGAIARGFSVLPGKDKKGRDARFVDNKANEDGTFNIYDIRGKIVGTATAK